MARKNRLFAKLASDVDTSGNLAASGIQSEALDIGVTVYASRASLPTSGNTTGDQAYVTGNNRLYIWNGSGWYNVALINKAPSIQSVLDSDSGTTPFTLSSEGAVTRITITAADSDGDPITYSATSDSGFSGLATLSQADNVFTITPFSSDSATTTSGTITFTATDGINIASSGVQTFTLQFISALWDETVLSIDTSSTNGLKNNVYIDRSSNNHSITPTGVSSRDAHGQSAFHPYHDNWSWEFGNSSAVNYTNSNDVAMGFGTDDFTIEFWVKFANSDNCVLADWRSSANGNFPTIYHYNGVFSYYHNGSFQITTTVSPNIGQWHHIAVCRSSNVTKMFIDGVQSGGNLADTTNYYVGATDRPIIGMSGYNNLPFLGLISNFRTIRGTGLYTSNFTPPTEKLTAVYNTRSLVAHTYRFYNEYSAQQTQTPGLNIINTVKVVPDNPFGIAEYAVGENKGSLYRPAVTNWNISALSSNLDLSGDFTIEMWWYPDINSSPPASEYIMDFGSNPRLSIFWYWNGNQATDYAFYAYTNGYRKFSTNSNQIYPNNAWTHLAFVRTISDGIVRLYANGVFQGATEVNFSGDPTGDQFNIGNSYGGNSAVPNYWSDLKITASAKYSSNFTPPTSPLGNTNAGLYFPFDNAGIFDKTGNHTLELTGNTVTSTTKTKYATTSMRFAAANDYLETNGLTMGGDGNLTIEGWFNFDFTNSNVWIAGHNVTYAGNTGHLQIFLNSGRPSWNVGGSVSNFTPVTGTLNTNQWYHLAFVKEGDDYSVYIDGTLDHTGNRTNTIGSYEWRIGNTYDGATQGFTGYIEDFQILNYAKYTTNFTPPTQTQGRTYQAES